MTNEPQLGHASYHSYHLPPQQIGKSAGRIKKLESELAIKESRLKEMKEHLNQIIPRVIDLFDLAKTTDWENWEHGAELAEVELILKNLIIPEP